MFRPKPSLTEERYVGAAVLYSILGISSLVECRFFYCLLLSLLHFLILCCFCFYMFLCSFDEIGQWVQIIMIRYSLSFLLVCILDEVHTCAHVHNIHAYICGGLNI